MRNLLKFVLITSIVAPATTVAIAVRAKCAKHQILISGKIADASSPNPRIVLVATFQQGQPIVAITDASNGQFRTSLRFDTYKSRGFFRADNCSRRPQTLTVILFQKKEEIDRIELDLSRDFMFAAEQSQYKLRENITLGSPKSK